MKILTSASLNMLLICALCLMIVLYNTKDNGVFYDNSWKKLADHRELTIVELEQKLYDKNRVRAVADTLKGNWQDSANIYWNETGCVVMAHEGYFTEFNVLNGLQTIRYGKWWSE